MESERARAIIGERIAVLDPDASDPEGMADERFWEEIQRDYDPTSHADVLVDLACAEENAPYVAEGLLKRPGLIEQMDFRGNRVSLRILNRLDADACPGAVGISDEAVRRLQFEKQRQLDLGGDVSPRG